MQLPYEDLHLNTSGVFFWFCKHSALHFLILWLILCTHFEDQVVKTNPISLTTLSRYRNANHELRNQDHTSVQKFLEDTTTQVLHILAIDSTNWNKIRRWPRWFK